MCLGCVLPDLSQHRIIDRGATHEPIDEILIPGVSKLDDDIVHQVAESRILHQAASNSMTLFVAMAPLAQRNDVVRAKGRNDRINGILALGVRGRGRDCGSAC
jgi:hypothetical protein